MLSTWYGLPWYGDFKYSPKRTAADRVLRDKAFKIASDQKYDRYQTGLTSMVYKVFDKKSSGSGLPSNKENIQIANELISQLLQNLKKESRFGWYAVIEYI